MFSIEVDRDVIIDIRKVDARLLKCHEKILPEKVDFLKSYLQSLEKDVIISSIIVCGETNIIIDGHHRYHALTQLGVKNMPVTFVNYSSPMIKAYFDDRVLKNEIIDAVARGRLLPPKSTKHVICDKKTSFYMPIILISTNFCIETI